MREGSISFRDASPIDGQEQATKNSGHDDEQAPCVLAFGAATTELGGHPFGTSGGVARFQQPSSSWNSRSHAP